MPQLGDLLAVLQSLFAAAAIAVAVYGFGRPLARLFGHDTADRFERGVRSFLLGFPAAAFGLGTLGLLGCLGTISVSLLTLAGVLLACVEVACSAAGENGIGGLIAALRRALQPTSVWGQVVCSIVAVVLGAILITALAPPTNLAVLGEVLEPSKEALQAGTFRTGAQGGLDWLSLSQIWSMWGLALDGPVAANLVQWQLMVLVALAAVLLARRWCDSELSRLAGLLVLLSPVNWSAQGPLAFGAGSGLAVPLLLLAVIELPRHGRTITGEINFALAAVVASLPGSAPVVAEFNLWQSPHLLIALSGLTFGSPRQRLVLAGVLAVFLASAVWPGSVALYLLALPVMAAAGVMGTTLLLRLRGPERMALAGIAGCLICVQMSDLVRTAMPKAPVALGCQSRNDYLLATSGSYRAALVFNQIRQPEQRLYSTMSGCVYFASPTTFAAPEDQALAETPAAQIAAAYRQGCDYLLLADRLDGPAGTPAAEDASELATAGGGAVPAEKFAGAVEVIPIVQYEFADEYQRTTRYRLWKLQGRRAAASPDSETAPGGEEVSSRPRSPTR